MTHHSHVVDADASACTVHGRQWRLWNLFPSFVVECVALGEADHSRILAGCTERIALDKSFLITGRKISEIAGFHRSLRRMDVGDGRSFRNGNYL